MRKSIGRRSSKSLRKRSGRRMSGGSNNSNENPWFNWVDEARELKPSIHTILATLELKMDDEADIEYCDKNNKNKFDNFILQLKELEKRYKFKPYLRSELNKYIEFLNKQYDDIIEVDRGYFCDGVRVTPAQTQTTSAVKFTPQIQELTKYRIGIEIEGCETKPLHDLEHFGNDEDLSIKCKEGTPYKGNEYILKLNASEDAVAVAVAAAPAVADSVTDAAASNAVYPKDAKDVSYEAYQAVKDINLLATIPTENDLYNVANLPYLKNEIDKIEGNFFGDDTEKCGKADFYEIIVKNRAGRETTRKYLTQDKVDYERKKHKGEITVKKMNIQDSTCGLHIHMSIETDSLKTNKLEGLKYICRLYDSWFELQSKFIEKKYNNKSLYQDTNYSEQNKEYPKYITSKELWVEFKDKINGLADEEELVKQNYELLFFYINGYKCEESPTGKLRNYFTLVTNPDDNSIHVEFRGFAVRSQLYNMICYICINLKDLFNKAFPKTAVGGSKSKYLNKKKNRRKYTSNKKNRRKYTSNKKNRRKYISNKKNRKT